MKKFFRKLSLVPKGLRYKLMIAFSLMSIIPLLVSVYLVVNYIFPTIESIGDISIIVLWTTVIALLGLLLAKRLIEPVIDMALEAKIIAGGEYDREIKVKEEDEIGELGNAINEMTRRIKANLEELSTYSERTKQINLEIHKKVIALSNLLQVGDAISMATFPLDNILSMIAEKVAQTYETGYTLLLKWESEKEEIMTVRSSCNLPTYLLEDMKVKRGEGFLGKLVLKPEAWSIDKQTRFSKNVRPFLDAYGLKNLVILPILTHMKLVAFLIVGNQLDDFEYKEDDIELYKVFSRQVGIAIENDYLFRRTKELAITDDLTGLYNKKFIVTRLEEEIKRAILFQRPCSFMIIGIDDFDNLKKSYDEISIEKALKKIASILQKHLTEISKAARLGASEFALLLPEVNKRGAAKRAEDLRKDIEESFLKKLVPDDVEKLTVSIGVSENPIDGSTAVELIEKANKAIEIAKTLGKNRVIAHIGG